MLDVTTLEGWLWDAAFQIRGPLDAPKLKDYILPLEEAMVLLREAEEERSAADEELERVLVDLGLGGFRRG
jgi:type I restriction enzyme M protein